MNSVFDVQKTIREILLKVLDNHSLEQLNKIPEGKIEVIQGDVKKVIPKLINEQHNFGNAQNFSRKNFGASKTKKRQSFEGFDVVIMARPNLKESFLKWGLDVCKKGTRLFYYGFCRDEEVNKMVDELKKEAKSLKKKIRVIEIVSSGEIAPYKHRYRVEMVVG